MRNLTLFALMLVLPLTCLGDVIVGKVVGVSDGDTLTVLDGSNRRYKIRLSAIDAPEKNQPFGMRSKQALSSLCFGKDARVTPLKEDRYGRTVADVDCGGKNVNEEQIRTGMAWVYRKYANGYGVLYTLEDVARTGQQGLWIDQNPMPPWEWRHNRKIN
ncbi:MAG: thermonuclease family protein [Pseudomonadota bacterium]